MSPSSAAEGEPSIGPRVLIVDADRRIQQSLADVLRVTGKVRVIGSAGDVRDALERVADLQPDVVILDPRLPDLQAGTALLTSINLGWPAIRVVLTGWDDDGGGELARAAGVCAYVGKSAPPEEFVSAVVTACAEGVTASR
jgi:DNA-binding NarL/FixJ family response regulator